MYSCFTHVIKKKKEREQGVWKGREKRRKKSGMGKERNPVAELVCNFVCG